MKKLLTISLLFLCLSSFGQKQNFGQWLGRYAKRNALPASFCFASGCWSGFADAIQFHYPGFKKVFPKAVDQYWCPDLSWTNKYKNHDPAQGAAYPGSTTIFVPLTDGWHFAQFQSHALIGCAIAFHLGEKQKWYFYFVDLFVYSVAFTAGKNLTYELLNQ